MCVLVSEARSAQGVRKGLGMRLHCSYQSLAQEVGAGCRKTLFLNFVANYWLCTRSNCYQTVSSLPCIFSPSGLLPNFKPAVQDSEAAEPR